MLKKLLWALAPIVVSKVLGRRRQGQMNSKYPRGTNRRYKR